MRVTLRDAPAARGVVLGIGYFLRAVRNRSLVLRRVSGWSAFYTYAGEVVAPFMQVLLVAYRREMGRMGRMGHGGEAWQAQHAAQLTNIVLFVGCWRRFLLDGVSHARPVGARVGGGRV
ncbi:hypothetical protein HS125_19670 [bacterium]|nr:hypothetical protein [bacterium]